VQHGRGNAGGNLRPDEPPGCALSSAQKCNMPDVGTCVGCWAKRKKKPSKLALWGFNKHQQAGT